MKFRNYARWAVALLMTALSGCSPWTVRPIQESAPSDGSAVTPSAYVDSIWASKLIPAIVKAAPDARVLLDAIASSPDEAAKKFGHNEGGAAYFAVKGSGQVLAVDTVSRNGLLLLDVAQFDGKPDVSIQIGPVLRGTALRDATGLIRFTDFANQLAFADIANELNNRVLKTVLEPLDVKSLPHKTVEFTGVFALESGAKPPIRGVIPIVLKVEDAQ